MSLRCTRSAACSTPRCSFAIGWFELHGIWALALLAVLIVELVITLMDFVEEDLTRALPASERINHTLLALNYGAILTLLVPVLLEWSHQPTAIKPAWYGVSSVFMAVVAAGRADLRPARLLRRAPRQTSHPRSRRRAGCRPPRTAACARHRRDRVHRQPAGRGADHRRASGHGAGARSPESRGVRAAVPARHLARPDLQRRAHRHHRQSRRRADRQRAVDACASAAASCARG